MTKVVRTILVVDPRKILARGARRSLRALGYATPLLASFADRAIRLAIKQRPDLVLIDVRIDQALDGIETSAVLCRRFDVPIVYLANDIDEATLEQTRRAESFGCLLKPVNSGQLQTTIVVALFRHDAERRLRERERLLTTTMRSIGDAIISTDVSGTIVYMNPVAEQLTGWSAAQALGRSGEDVLPLVSDDSARRPLASSLRMTLDEMRTVKVDGLLTKVDGEERFVSDTTAPILDDDGSLRGAVMVIRDTAERRDLQRQLELSERLATLGTMAAGVAHEVNNPLAFILANITFVLEEIRRHRKDPARTEERHWLEIEGALGDAEVGAQRVGKIVHDLNTFTRAAPDLPQPVKVELALDWAVEVVRHEIESRGAIVRRSEPVPLVNASPTRLGQVFLNLLLNAAHALDPTRRETNEVVISTRTDKEGRAVVEVRDTGRGMTPEVMRRIFDPFFTTKPVGQGTGLGLSVCHGIVRSLGGTITFDSDPGRGALARVVLPGVPIGVSTQVPVARIRVTVPRSRLLILDDEREASALIKRALGDHHLLVCPETATEALAMVRGGSRFDLILCDLMMPIMTGMDLYEQILATDPEQARRIVFLSGGAFTPRTIEFMATVPNARLGKPYELHELRDLVTRLLLAMGPIALPSVWRRGPAARGAVKHLPPTHP